MPKEQKDNKKSFVEQTIEDAESIALRLGFVDSEGNADLTRCLRELELRKKK